ncbi:MAG: hypothetical protein P1U33_08455 [Litorivicinaceae bacterium]|nr:hypothetical protein [Litorivicinaceae bacterium]
MPTIGGAGSLVSLCDATEHTNACIKNTFFEQDAISEADRGSLPQVELIDDPRFWASVKHQKTCELQLSTGVITLAFSFWRDHMHEVFTETLLPTEPDNRAEQRLHQSLTWLILHELSHSELGHFRLADEFGVAQRSCKNSHALDAIGYDLRHLAPVCLEMQADHEATDTLLGAYSAEGWHEVREKVLAISGMMMLIELEDAKNNAEGRTHPKAATRIFQLLGHLAEMPLVRAQVHQDTSLIPVEKELQAFAHGVTIPCFFDAIQLSKAAGAVSIADDLGSPEDFFKDLEIAKLGDPSRYGELKTQGAQEWAKLWPCNEALKPILGSHFTN